MKTIPYNRHAAVEYAEKWALKRNPRYMDFEKMGGDCTNFASQCIYAGSGIMNYTPVTGWYYISPSKRSASWTGVGFLYKFLVNNKGAGPFGRVVDRAFAEPGDIIQLGKQNGIFYHSPVIISIQGNEIYTAAHSYDALYKPLSAYVYDKIRFIHIEGVRI